MSPTPSPLSPISGRTRILGLLAERGRSRDFALLPMQVPASSLETVLAGLRAIGNFAGAIVSMPHK